MNTKTVETLMEIKSLLKVANDVCDENSDHYIPNDNMCSTCNAHVVDHALNKVGRLMERCIESVDHLPEAIASDDEPDKETDQ